MIPDGWREVQDKEQLVQGDMAFGKLDNGAFGWGRVPDHLVGQYYRKQGLEGDCVVIRKLPIRH
jgi:hypothetical protein